jgi:hypothetical protein
MKIVNSFDLFDTLIGRKINNQDEIFDKCKILNKLDNFVEIRINSEKLAKENNIYYNLLDIYKYIQKHYKLTYSKTIQCLNNEIQIEYDNVYPIYLNINKLNSDSIIIVETYYTSEEIKKLLSKFNVIDIPIYTSSELNVSKSNGSMYEILKKMYKIKMHIGSNYVLDSQVPLSVKINSVHYNYKYHPNIIKIENNLTSYTKDYFKMIESSCNDIYDDHIWNIQLYYNIPILILFSNIILDFAKEKNIKEIIFINRNCKLLKIIFDKINQIKNINITTSELVFSYKIIENKKYLRKIIDQYNKETKYLIIDLHDGFTRIINELFKNVHNIEPYFYSIFNNNIATSNLTNIYSLYTNDTSLSRLMEVFNLYNIGEPIDYLMNIIKYNKFEYTETIPSIYLNVIDQIINTIDDKIINDLNQNFLLDFLQNLVDIKTKIMENSEYKILMDIYSVSNKYFLKNDYNLKPIKVIKYNIDGPINQSMKYILYK